MFWAILNTFLGSLSSILWKKSLDLNKVGQRLFMFFDLPIGFFVAIILLLIGFVQVSYDYTIYLLIFFIIVFSIFTIQINQFLYKNEKISVLIPYDNLDKIFIIIFGFLFFDNTSLFSFITALVTVFIVILFAVDFGNLKFPHNFHYIILRTFIVVFKNILIAFVIIKINAITFFSYNTIINTLLLLALIIINKELVGIKNSSGLFYRYRLGAAVVWQFSFFIGLFILEKQGLIISNLLGLLGIGITLIFSYFLLNDKPSKKDIIQAILVSTLVLIGYYLK